MCDEEKEILADLKQNYLMLGHPLFHTGISQIYQYYKGCLSIAKIQDFLATVYAYTLHKESHSNLQNPTYVWFKRYQFQIDLVR